MAQKWRIARVSRHWCAMDFDPVLCQDNDVLYIMLVTIIIIIIITLFQEGDIYITIVNHDGPQNNRNNITIKISLV